MTTLVSCGFLLLVIVQVTSGVSGVHERIVKHGNNRAISRQARGNSVDLFSPQITDSVERTQPGIDTTLLEDTSLRRRKRVAGLIGKLIFTGFDAVKFLVAGAEKLPFRDKCCRDYRKKGTFGKAVRDFKRVNPTAVSTVQLPDGVKGIAGVVDDRTLLLRRAGEDGYPVLEIINSAKHSKYLKDRKNWPVSDPPIERITYKQ